MTKILEFPKPCVILELDPRISSQINLEFSVSLRGSKATEAISRNSRIPKIKSKIPKIKF